MNTHILIGNLGQDPETRTTGGGTPVCELRVATSRSVKRGDSWEEVTDWHSVVVFGRQAENCSRFLRKGSKVGVQGTVQTDQWEDRDGNKRYSTKTYASRVEFLSPKNDDRGGYGGGGGYR